MSTQTVNPAQKQTPLEQYATYPFDTDQEYQQGIANILANGTLTDNSNLEDQEDILRRARTFFFNRVTGNSLTLEEVKAYEISLRAQLLSVTGEPINAPPPVSGATTTTEPTPTPATNTEAKGITTESSTRSAGLEGEPRMLTFGELKELIETGRLDQIPNNKVIPDALNEAPPSQSTAPARRKPWELVSESQGQNRDSAPSTTEEEGKEGNRP